jgi:hypothetical protein
MAVKFSDFTQKQDASVDVTNMVGYLATGELNIMIPPANLDTTYAVSTGNAGASPTISIQGTKPGQAAAIAPSTVSLTGSGATLLAGNGTTTIDFASTTYALAAGVNADPAVNTPVTLTGLAGGDAHTDTVNLIGTGTVQITSAGGVITIDGGSTGDVTSFSSTFGNYITGTTQTNAVGDVSIGTVNLSAIDGTSDANTKFLSKDNTWDVPTYTTYDLETTTVANGQTNVPVTLASAAGDDTLNLLGAGTVTIGSDSGTGLITITGGGVGDVTSINTATSGVSSTANPITLTGTAGAGPFTGAITVASNAYAGGADVGHVPSGGSAGEYLDGASGAWITIPAGYTSWNLTGDSGTTEAIADGNTVDVAGGTDITTVASSADTLTVNHDAITRTDTTSTDAPTAGTSVDLVKTISTSAQGHVTAIDVSTVTWPAGGGGFGSINQTTGTGSSLGAITLGSTPAAAFNCLISISGVTQNYLDAAGTPNWTVSTNTLTFAFNPPVTATNGIQIIVIA